MARNLDQRDGHSLDRVIEQVEFNAIFALTFIVLLVGALLALLLPWTWPRRLHSRDSGWFVGRAWQDASSFTELAFMG